MISLDFVIRVALESTQRSRTLHLLECHQGLQQLIHWNEREGCPNVHKNLLGARSDVLLDEKLRIGEVLLATYKTQMSSSPEIWLKLLFKVPSPLYAEKLAPHADQHAS